jgi:hypothetical protein
MDLKKAVKEKYGEAACVLSDMRAELFVLGLARALAGDSKTAEPYRCFPEVNEPSTPPP